MSSPAPPAVITAHAPMRFDLAGGWTDVPPFSMEVGGAVLNIGIARYAQVTIRPYIPAHVRLASSDYGQVIEGVPEDVLIYNGELDLLKAAVRVAGLTGIDVSVGSDAPPGAGLGASASVGVALVGALNALRATSWPRASLADLAHRLEVEEIRVAGGRQDQYAALGGGCQFIEFRDPAVHATRLALSDSVSQRLRDSLVLCYTGRSRVSGTIISTVMGNYRRAEPRTTQALYRLRGIAVAMRDALLSGDLAAVGPLLLENWRCQKDLDASVTTPQLDSLFDIALRHGATGGKALGAGGGGCLLFHAPDAAERVRAALADVGATIFDFDFDFEGLQVLSTAAPSDCHAERSEASAPLASPEEPPGSARGDSRRD